MIPSDNKAYPLISVVVPVFNVEKYLEQCVYSICEQSYTNLEIILVNDGSSDSSPQICEKLHKGDIRVKVIHKHNGGPAEARNAGTMSAKGDLILYVDSDDYIYKDMILWMYQAMIEANTQAAICKMRNTHSDLLLTQSKIKKSKYSGKDISKQMLYQHISNGPVCMLLPKAICLENPFPVGKMHEDLFVTYKMVYQCRDIVLLDEALYIYRQNPDSIMHRPFSTKLFDAIEAVNEMISFAYNVDISLLAAANARKFSLYAQILRAVPDSDLSLISKQIELWNYIKSYRWKMMTDRNARLKNRLAALCTLFGRKIFKTIANKVS